MQEHLINSIKEVDKCLGNYYRENIYQSALLTELQLTGYLVQSEVVVPVIYKGVNVGFERADIVVYKDSKIEYILELKSQSTRISSKEINQLRKYLLNLNCEKGLLVNFYDKLEIYEVNTLNHKKISCDTS